MKKKKLYRIESEYRTIAKFLAKSVPHATEEQEEYRQFLKERVRLKKTLWKLGSKKLVLQVDKECIEEQLKTR